MFNVSRDDHNPLISPRENLPWLAEATFNPSPILKGDDLHLLFRASTHPALYDSVELEFSTIGIATSHDGGVHFDEPRQLIVPEHDWEHFGCEDPRVTKLGDTYYVFYTALGGYPFGPDNIKVAVALTKDLKTIDSKHLVTQFNAKAMALFPERVGGKLRAVLTVNSDLPPSRIAIAEFDRPEDMWSPHYWDRWYQHLDEHTLTLKRDDSDHVEVGAPPIWTKDGWMLLYSHIQDYFSDNKVFGIEAALLALEDPTHVVRRTVYPFMAPEEGYEKYGRLPKIIFPSGATRHGDRLTVYYGSTDTTCCRASLSFQGLLDSMSSDGSIKQHVERSEHNPILKPIAEHAWESNYVLNPAAIELEGDVHILYRALGPDNTSVIGYARSHDGVKITQRLTQPIYEPRAKFEMKAGGPTDLSGCEDARIVRIGERLHITYTAYDSVTAPRVAQSSISVKDFLAHEWNWTLPELVSPEGVDDKDACIFPEKVNGEYMVLHRISGHVCADFVDRLDFHNQQLTRCIQVFGPRHGMWDDRKVGISGPPIKTSSGWLLYYHGVTAKGEYSLGAVLLDRHDPTKVIGRTSQPIMTPTEEWEREGWINNVIFPCGQVVRDDTVYLYYGGADTVVGVAMMSLGGLVKALRPL
jgi:predicted GH43/DUF377 family glycosyl hydrolase